MTFIIKNIPRILYSIGVPCLEINRVVQMATASYNKGLFCLLVFTYQCSSLLYWKSEEEAFVLYTFSIIHPSSCKWSNSIKETKIEIRKRKYEITVSGSEALKFYSKSTAEIKSHKNFLSNNSIQVQYWNAIHFLFLAHLITTKKNSGTFSLNFSARL